MHFGKKWWLGPQYIRPYPVLKRVRKIAYQLELSTELLKAIHLVFHMSLLRKYVSNGTHTIIDTAIQFDNKLAYDEQSIRIINRQIWRLRSKEIPLEQYYFFPVLSLLPNFVIARKIQQDLALSPLVCSLNEVDTKTTSLPKDMDEKLWLKSQK